MQFFELLSIQMQQWRGPATAAWFVAAYLGSGYVGDGFRFGWASDAFGSLFPYNPGMGLKARRAFRNDLKTQPTDVDPRAFIEGLSDARRQGDCEILLEMLSQESGEPAVMWGTSIIGFGSYHYKGTGGREGDWPRVGFSPRKQATTIYCMPGFKEQGDLLARLGPHKTSVSCLYVRRLEQIDLEVLRAIVKRSLEQMKRIYGE